MTENPDDRLAIQRGVRALEFAERAYAEIPDESLICATERGGEKIHPCLQAWLQLERTSGEFGARPGSEADRAKPPMGRRRGANSAPDRVGEPLKLMRIKKQSNTDSSADGLGRSPRRIRSGHSGRTNPGTGSGGKTDAPPAVEAAKYGGLAWMSG